MSRYKKTFPVSYIHPPTESVVDGPCSQGAKAHRRSKTLTPGPMCNTSHDGYGWRELSYHTAIAAGAKPCREPQCFPTHLKAVS